MKHKNTGSQGYKRTDAEKKVGERYQLCWDSNLGSWEDKIEHIIKYIRRQTLTRFLARYEVFKKILNIKGSVIECGVFQGEGLMTWAKLSSILEPVNMSRKIYGFDTFEGYLPEMSKKDMIGQGKLKLETEVCADSFDELNEIIRIYDSNRFLGQVEKVYLIKGDANETIPKFIEENPYTIVSLLHLDFGYYEVTKTAFECFYPRMPKGGIILFIATDPSLVPGQAIAIMEQIGIGNLRLQRIGYEPYMAFAIKE